jgi:AraC-like DNA-binding protein
MDMLSEAMYRVQFRSLVPGIAELSAPWGLSFPWVGPGMKRPEHIPQDVHELTMRQHLRHVVFHAVLAGRCTVVVDAVPGAPKTRGNVPGEIELAGGDLLVMTRHAAHRIADRTDTPCRDIFDVLPRPPVLTANKLSLGGGGAITSLVFGVFLFRGDLGGRFVESLPDFIHLRSSVDGTHTWMPDLLGLLINESAAPGAGSAIIVDRLASVLFCHAVRHHFKHREGERAAGNWLRACLDENIGPAMALMHARPADPWTVESLGAEVAMSRSSFASRFTACVGVPPLQYLADLRVQIACEALTGGEESIKSIARSVGYRSEAAFSTAFRRAVGVAPVDYRKSHVSMRERMQSQIPEMLPPNGSLVRPDRRPSKR